MDSVEIVEVGLLRDISLRAVVLTGSVKLVNSSRGAAYMNFVLFVTEALSASTPCSGNVGVDWGGMLGGGRRSWEVRLIACLAARLTTRRVARLRRN